jgi:DNA-binding transcriptional LysR family regulator
MLERMNIEIRWLLSFVAVAEELHFSKAARRLNLAQPALTAQIKQLERAIGAPLFERTNRMGGLTPAGLAILPEARTIIERTLSLDRIAFKAAKGELGRLRLGIIPPAAIPVVAESLRRFTMQFPEIQIRVRQDSQSHLIAALRERDLDVILGRQPVGPDGRHTLSHREVIVEEQGVLLRKDHLLAGGATAPLKKLDGCTLLLLRGNPHFGGNLSDLAAQHGVMLKPVYSAEDFPSLHWMVRAGLGVAPCSLLLADSVASGLVVKRLRPSPPKLAIHCIWHGVAPAPTATAWLKILKMGSVEVGAVDARENKVR